MDDRWIELQAVRDDGRTEIVAQMGNESLRHRRQPGLVAGDGADRRPLRQQVERARAQACDHIRPGHSLILGFSST
jgi:hypothetical protein